VDFLVVGQVAGRHYVCPTQPAAIPNSDQFYDKKICLHTNF